MSWDWLKDFATVVRDLGVGIGTLLGGWGALPLFKKWNRKEREKEQYKEKCIKRFASHLRNKDEALIWKLKNSDKILAIYKPNMTWQHIKTWSTYKALGYESGDWDKEVGGNELDNFKEDEPIDFT